MAKHPVSRDQISSRLLENLQEALSFQKIGQMPEAEKIYRQAIRDNPDNPDVLHLAAIFFDQIENNQYAISLLKKIATKKANDFAFNMLMGRCLYKASLYEDSVQYFKKALFLNSEDPNANFYMGLCVYKMGLKRDAEQFFRRSLAKKNSLEVKNKLCEILLANKQHAEIISLLEPEIARGVFTYETVIFLAAAHGFNSLKGMQKLIDSIMLFPARDEAKTLFALTLAEDYKPGAINETLRKVALLCLESKNVNHINLERFWARQFFETPEEYRPAQLLNAKSYQEFVDLFEAPDYKKVLLVPYFIAGIKKILICTVELENLVTYSRHYYLKKIAAGEILETIDKDFLNAISHQSFFNEFVFNITAEEKENLERLNLKTEEHLLVYSCYRSLVDLNNHIDLLQSASHYTPWLRDVIELQIGQIIAEQKAKKEIVSLGKIKDKTSKEVQGQYEENPYPRWRTCNFLLPFSYSSIDGKYCKKPEVLIAGCGTGKHIFTTYIENPWKKITAIDLSRSSLAYAKIKAQEYGIKNIDFFHMDILELHGLNKKFDMIEAVGVLHHMKDPAAGLKVLAEHLRPGSRMRLGFYSELGRQDVVKARALIAEKGFSPDREGIQTCRAYIKESPNFENLKNTQDFYSLSACRDLIFHVQETRYTIPELQKLIDENNLEFEGFALPSHKIAQYVTAFPEDKDGRNLQNWHEFEMKHPNFFAAMYNFSCRKV